MKLAALVLVVVVLGLPVNDLSRYALLVIATVIVVAGDGLAAAQAVARRGGGRGAVRAGADVARGAAHRGGAQRLSRRWRRRRARDFAAAAAFRLMAAEFDANYPPARRCDPRQDGCWRGQGFRGKPSRFSADGIYDRQAIRGA